MSYRCLSCSQAGSTHRSLQFRAMNYRALEIRRWSRCVLSTALHHRVALAGGGAWAIILENRSFTPASTTLLIAMGGWTPACMFSLGEPRASSGRSGCGTSAE